MPILRTKYHTPFMIIVRNAKCRYYNPANSKKQRGVRVCKSSEIKQARNEHNAYLKKMLEMLCNFDLGDLFVTLTHIELLDPEAAHKCMMIVLGKVRKALKRKNIPFVYYIKTEAGETTRPHHHLLIRNTSPEIIGLLLKYWSEFGNIKHVKEIYDMASGKLVKYILDGGDHKDLNFEKYSHSRNLKQPKIERKVLPYNSFRENPRIPKPHNGYRYELVPGSLYNGFPDIDGFTYQEYELRKAKIQE